MAHDPAPRPAAPEAVTFHERLWPGPIGWASMVGFAAFVAVALLPVDVGVALGAACVTAVVGVVIAIRTSPMVAVEGADLVAGRARIPVALLGETRVLDRAGVRAALGPGSDARAYGCLRAWIPTAVEVQVTDPSDPTPSWLVSTRRAPRLLAALEAAQGRSQAAHSEQMG